MSAEPSETRRFGRNADGSIHPVLINGLIALISAMAGGAGGSYTTMGSVSGELREFKAMISAELAAVRKEIETGNRDFDRMQRQIENNSKEIEALKLWRARLEATLPQAPR